MLPLMISNREFGEFGDAAGTRKTSRAIDLLVDKVVTWRCER